MTAKKTTNRGRKTNLKKAIETGNKAELTLYETLAEKMKSGTLTPTEQSNFLKLKSKYEEKQALETDIKSNPFIFSTKKVGEFFDITSRQVRNWVMTGCPRVKHGWFDLKSVMLWYLENKYETKFEQSDETIQAYKRDYERYRAEKMKIEVEKMKEKLIDREKIALIGAAQIAEVKAGLIQLKDRLPKDIHSQVEEEVFLLLDNFSRNGVFGYDNGNGDN